MPNPFDIIGDILDPTKWFEKLTETGKALLGPFIDNLGGMFKEGGILSGEVLGLSLIHI